MVVGVVYMGATRGLLRWFGDCWCANPPCSTPLDTAPTLTNLVCCVVVLLCCVLCLPVTIPPSHHPTIPPSHHPTPCIMSPALHACCTFAQERKQFLRAAANRTKSAAERRRELEKASRSHMHADESRGSASSGGSSQHHEKHPKPRTRDPFRAANSLRAHQGPSHMDGGDGTVDSALGGAIHHHGSLLARACWHGGLFSLHPTLLGLLFCLF